MESLYGWMKTVIIFMILITVILNLLGKSSYKKYVSLVTGLLLILFVIKPLISIAGGNEYFSFSLDSYEYIIKAEDISRDLLEMENKSNDEILKEYKDLLVRQTESLLEEKGLTLLTMSLQLNRKADTTNYGKIEHMEIEASYQKYDGQAEDNVNVAIDKIEISIPKQEKERAEADYCSPMEIQMKKLLADFYNIETTNINIIIREDHNG